MIIKRILYLLVITFLFSSCMNTTDGNGIVTKEERKISSFNKINISGGYEILINQGDVEKLELEVDENLIELIKSEVSNNTLYISTISPIGDANSLKLYITVVNIEDIDISGAVELKNKGSIKAANLEIEVSGAADIDLAIEAENLSMEMSGASETTLMGDATNFEVEISGAGELDAKKLKTRNTTIDISGAGSAIVFAKKTLKVNVSGAGSVKYKGHPKIEKDISGAGSIEKI